MRTVYCTAAVVDYARIRYHRVPVVACLLLLRAADADKLEETVNERIKNKLIPDTQVTAKFERRRPPQGLLRTSSVRPLSSVRGPAPPLDAGAGQDPIVAHIAR